jgi:hypothetical protein
MKRTALNENTAPAKACLFVTDGERHGVRFAESGSGEPGRFTIVGYSGGIIADHWYWGNLAFDLNGVKFAKSPTPVLEEHFTSYRIGVTTKQEITDAVTAEGRFLSNDRARQIASDLKEDFPMEASLFIHPLSVESVKQGASIEVNGLTLEGPGTVFRKAVIKELSMVVFGADSNTQSVAAAAGDEQVQFTFVNKENQTMADQKETKLSIADLTVEKFADACPAVHAKIVEAAKADGRQLEQTRFAELKAACEDDYELLTTCFADGKSVNDALKAKCAKLATANAELTKAAQKPTTADELAAAEFSDTEAQQVAAKNKAEDAKKPVKFMNKVAEYAKANSCSLREAVIKCAELYPELHEKMREGSE